MGMLKVWTFSVISLAAVCAITASQNEGVYQSDTHDFGTILKLVERLEKRVNVLEAENAQLEKRVDVLEAENAQQRLEIAELKAFVEREEKGQPEPGDETRKTENGHTAERERDTDHRNIDRIQRAYPEVPIAFFATLYSHAHHLGQNQNILFDSVTTNVGNAYDHNSGMFKAPVGGLYVFSTSLVAYTHNRTHCGFVLNNNHVTKMYLRGDDNVYDGDSHTIILQLKPGDDVSVQHYDTGMSVYGRNYSMFSGFLLSTIDPGMSIVG